jgi:hypothetical protein
VKPGATVAFAPPLGCRLISNLEWEVMASDDHGPRRKRPPLTGQSFPKWLGSLVYLRLRQLPPGQHVRQSLSKTAHRGDELWPEAVGELSCILSSFSSHPSDISLSLSSNCYSNCSRQRCGRDLKRFDASYQVVECLQPTLKHHPPACTKGIPAFLHQLSRNPCTDKDSVHFLQGIEQEPWSVPQCIGYRASLSQHRVRISHLSNSPPSATSFVSTSSGYLGEDRGWLGFNIGKLCFFPCPPCRHGTRTVSPYSETDTEQAIETKNE